MWQADQRIQKIDDALHVLRSERIRCTDPADAIRASESIDMRLDERIRLMRDRDRDSKLSATG